jgi:uncharacterized protein (DUF58 family)
LIYPTRRAILSAAALAPAALVVGVLAPAWWTIGLAGIASLLALLIADFLLGPGRSDASVICEGPGAVSVGAGFAVGAYVRFASAAPAVVEVALGGSGLVAASQSRQRIAIQGNLGAAEFEFTALRRGEAKIGPVWIRWLGPLGLVWKQKQLALDQVVTVTPDIRPVREMSAQLIHRDATFGMVAQRQIGDGAEFEALAEFRQGMDKRWIDWKQSARHTALLAKEFRTERNNTIMMAVDCGRVMSEPLAGVPKIDRAVSAALLTAFIALKDGDRVGFFGFDSHPRVASNAVAGPRSFALLQKVAARIDYSPFETNYTLGLATLAERLHRRSLIIVFTDFADTASAELMLQAVGSLLARHLVLFVVLRDEELEQLIDAEPEEAADVSRSITAAALLRERQLVISRLRRLGVEILEARRDEAAPALVNSYLNLKRRNLL